jgi:predicted secreted Zn-dependent protease
MIALGMMNVRTASASALVLLVVSGCATIQPPPVDIVKVQTSTATKFYPVTGTTTRAIFEQIEGAGLADHHGLRAAGLTSADWRVAGQTLDRRSYGVACAPLRVSFTLSIVVTLPRHEQPDGLSEELRTRWDRYASRIASHEQRHVDIYLDAAKTLKSRTDAFLKRREWSSCADFETALKALLNEHTVDAKKRQDQFDIDDRATFELDRKPLQTQLDAHRARLSRLESEMRDLAATASDLSRKSQDARSAIESANAELLKSRASCAQRQVAGQVRAICLRHEQSLQAAVAAHNTLVEQHNAAIQRHNELADEFNRLSAETNTIIDTLNWTQ